MEVEFWGSPHLHLQLGIALFCCPWAFNHTGVVGGLFPSLSSVPPGLHGHCYLFSHQIQPGGTMERIFS